MNILEESRMLSGYELAFARKLVLERYRKCIAKILSKVECDFCGRCCREIPVQIDIDEVERISEYLGISTQKFIKKYTVLRDVGFGEKLYLKTPCPFLKNNRCTIYPLRPRVCRTYPFIADISVLVGINKCKIASEIDRKYLKVYNELRENPDILSKFKLTNASDEEKLYMKISNIIWKRLKREGFIKEEESKDLYTSILKATVNPKNKPGDSVAALLDVWVLCYLAEKWDEVEVD